MFKVLAILMGAEPMFKNSIPTAQAYLFSAPAAFAGDIIASDETNVEQAQLVAASGVYPVAYGLAMKYVTGGIQQFNGGAEAATAFAGVLLRSVPSISGAAADDSAAPPAGGTPWANNLPVGLGVRGYVAVSCVYGTPARGGIVYVRIISSVNNTVVGSFDATSDGGNNVALTATQAEWASDGKDSNNIAVLRIAR